MNTRKGVANLLERIAWFLSSIAVRVDQEESSRITELLYQVWYDAQETEA